MTRTEQLLLQCRAMQVMWTPDIEKLVELVRLQHEALLRVKSVKFHQIQEAIEAFNKWESGE